MTVLKKALCVLGYILYFSISFQIIVVSFMVPPDMSTQAQGIKELVIAVIMGIYFPGLICIEFFYINHLERQLNALKNELIATSCKAEFYKNRQRKY